MSSPDTDPAASGSDDVTTDALVVDRIVDGRYAVLLIGPREVELVVERTLLPDGTAEGDWFRLGLIPDPALTAQRRADVERRLARLRTERRGGRFSAEE
jgi:hypothetical protein